MKRFHVHVHVRDIDQSVKFYTTLFGVQPAKRKSDYAKWMLDDPYVNFAITTQRDHVGLSHLGIQLDNEDALKHLSRNAREASGALLVERRAHCGYAIGNKAWATDPQDVRWELFHTYQQEHEHFGCGAEETWHEARDGTRLAVEPPSCSAGKAHI